LNFYFCSLKWHICLDRCAFLGLLLVVMLTILWCTLVIYPGHFTFETWTFLNMFFLKKEFFWSVWFLKIYVMTLC
jgi:hypothetical protein